MSDQEIHDIGTLLQTVETVATKSKQTLSITRWVLAMVAGGILLVGRFEFKQADHEKRISINEQDTKELRTTTYSVVSDVAGIKGRLGITRVEIPKRALQAWKGEEPEPQQQ